MYTFFHINIHIHILTISMIIFERLNRNIILRFMKSHRCLVVDENVIFHLKCIIENPEINSIIMQAT